MSRTVCWFSCGVTSAVATKLALESAPDAEIVYIDTGSEHPDNPRFIADCEKWYGRPIITIKNPEFADTFAVYEKRRYIAGIAGAPCTLELKKAMRERYERPGDIQVFGFDASEKNRAERFQANQPEVSMWCPLIENGITKDECFLRLQQAGIALPTMYLMGYRNNNCGRTGCVKANAGYWNKRKRDFPEATEQMAEIEERLGVKLCQATINGVRQRVSLRDLPPDAGRYSDEPPITCGLLCDPLPETLP